ncbi:hypothetical protein RB195_012256 [Necator americanus]|uniref:Uncharacterized protein n=1 Tax=Necator americanus TaxID=51031 RepID=A0ABR1D673_NECAM
MVNPCSLRGELVILAFGGTDIKRAAIRCSYPSSKSVRPSVCGLASTRRLAEISRREAAAAVAPLSRSSSSLVSSCCCHHHRALSGSASSRRGPIESHPSKRYEHTPPASQLDIRPTATKSYRKPS